MKSRNYSSIPGNTFSPMIGTLANSADPDQMPQNAASDQGLHHLLTGVSIRNKNEKVRQTPLTGNGLTQLIRMAESTKHIWVQGKCVAEKKGTARVNANYNYCENPKISGTQKIFCNYPKI